MLIYNKNKFKTMKEKKSFWLINPVDEVRISMPSINEANDDYTLSVKMNGGIETFSNQRSLKDVFEFIEKIIEYTKKFRKASDEEAPF